jgi:hypothetical protein
METRRSFLSCDNRSALANLLLGFADLANAEVEAIGHSTGWLSLQQGSQRLGLDTKRKAAVTGGSLYIRAR